MLTTSYYTSPLLKQLDVNPVSISSRPPSWFTGNWYRKLAPPIRPNIVVMYKNGDITKDRYTSLYKTMILKLLDAESIYTDIQNLYGDNAVLLCYERPGEFCHRRLVADWFKEKLNITVEELTLPIKTLW